MKHNTSQLNPSVWIGGFLILLGIVFLLGQLLNIALWGFLWPFVIIAFGALFFVAMMTGGKDAAWLAIPGSIITMTGLILLYQNSFRQWESWAYAWALIAPTALGIGLYIAGHWGENESLKAAGRVLAWVGIAIFLVFGAFFELAFGLFGTRSTGRVLWPVFLVLLGLYLLFGRTLRSWMAPAAMTRPRSATPAAPSSVVKVVEQLPPTPPPAPRPPEPPALEQPKQE